MKVVQSSHTLPMSAACARAILDACAGTSGQLKARLAAVAALPCDSSDSAEAERLELLGSIATRWLDDPAAAPTLIPLVRGMATVEIPASPRCGMLSFD